MAGVPERNSLLFKADRAVGRHLFLLGILLLFVIVLGLITPAIVTVYAIHQHQPWWMAAGAAGVTLAGVAAALRPVSKILGPEGITGIVKQRNNNPAIGLLGSATGSGQPPSSAS